MFRYRVAADQAVFVPDQSDNEDIEDRQHDEAEAVRVRVAIELVEDEEAEDDKGKRIGPELVSEQPDDEERLDCAVAEEVEGIEALGADVEILRRAQQVGRHKVIRILEQLLLGKRIEQPGDGAGADEGEDKATCAFDQRMSPLQHEADLKDLVDAAFVQLESCRWHAAKCASPCNRSLGSSVRQRSKTYGQRVWKRQPLGGFTGLGTSPLRMMRWRAAPGSGTGTAESRASA